MHRYTRAAWAAPVLALLLAAHPAAAGPVSWGFRLTTPDGQLLAERSGITETYFGEYLLPIGPYDGVPQPPTVGVTRVERNRAEGRVTIVDEGSGQTGTVFLWAEYAWEYEINPDGSLEPIYEGYTDYGPTWRAGLPVPRLTLGARHYDVYSGDPGSLRVQVSDAAATPEPGTLALAGLGFAAVGLRRLRRRG